MTTRVIFLVEYPFDERDYNRFGVEILQKNGFAVEVWDFTSVLHPTFNVHVKVPDPIRYYGHHKFSTNQAMMAALSDLNPLCFVVCRLGYRYDTWPIYRALSQTMVKYCVMTTSAIPACAPQRAVLYTYAKRITRLLQSPLWKILNKTFPFLPLTWVRVRPATVLLAGGERSTLCDYPVSKQTTILWTHALDYDIFLEEQDQPLKSAGQKTGVFLDEYMPFHPDYSYMGVPSPTKPEEYYPALCGLFDQLERECGIQVLIAAHPCAQYEDRCAYFGGRPIHRGRTAELVRQATLTIAHSSTAINFAVLFEKPVLFITTKRLEQSPATGPLIAGMSAWLKKAPINLDGLQHIDWEKEFTVDKAAYACYREGYIKKAGTPEQPLWEIFSQYVRKIQD